MKFRYSWLVISFVLLALFAILIYSKKPTNSILSTKVSDKAYIKLLKEVINHVKTSYVEEIDEKKLEEGAVNGMLASLDPHSSYMPPEPFKEMNIQITGSFGGVGIELTIKDEKLTVVAPIEDTPAERAGMKSNDHIAKIDSKFTKGMSITDAVKIMRGQPGTKVTLTILRDGSPKPYIFPLTRAEIKTKSLKSRMLSKGYGYIRIASFQARTGDEFRDALSKIRTASDGDIKGVVIDLRNNPGGLIDQASKVADTFIGEGLESGLIVYTQGRTNESRQNLSAVVGPKEPKYPIVVLMNGGSASASEILAGALQDHKRAIIMGTQSFGKGSVQSIYPMKGGAGLKLTTARYYTPNGRSIQVKGITPDIIVNQIKQNPISSSRRESIDVHEKDLSGHLLNLKTKPEEKKKDTMPVKPAKDPELLKDHQLDRAFELLTGLNALKGVSGFNDAKNGAK